ncbi:acyl carrier protein [Amycolatopsis anabasis]|uniref:acyl carrier protein n=1 Tax=Amycolatopsis anabasis TaxID=1840409 RepID=UPI00131C37A0|nr:acyl carrier protein [Amycolatopsis anabasis]
MRRLRDLVSRTRSGSLRSSELTSATITVTNLGATGARFLNALRGFATDNELGALAPDENLRETLELDSLDFLTFIERLSAGLGQRIDEDDYDRLATIESGIAFLTNHGR